MDKCPALFTDIAKANVIPESSKKRILAAANAPSDDEWQPWSDPPQPARLETTPPQQVGWGGCSTGGSRSNAPALGIALALAVGARRRRR